jgi:hypothetical protein
MHVAHDRQKNDESGGNVGAGESGKEGLGSLKPSDGSA